MGTGIAQVAAQNDFDVIVFDVNDRVLSKSKASIEDGLQKLTEKGKVSVEQKSKIVQHITFTTEINDCIADVIIEAVAENLVIKQQLFDQLALLNSDNVIFATNTSSIPVSALSHDKKYTAQLAGMHFFNPAPVMKLVEIIRSQKTSEVIIEALVELAKKWVKRPWFVMMHPVSSSTALPVIITLKPCKCLNKA